MADPSAESIAAALVADWSQLTTTVPDLSAAIVERLTVDRLTVTSLLRPELLEHTTA